MFGKEAERELYRCQAKLEVLQTLLDEAMKDKAALTDQIKRLQEALFSVHSPDAYRDMKAEEYEAKQPKISQEEEERYKVEREVYNRYLQQMEQPTFVTGDDLDDLIETGLIRTMEEPTSIHGNNES